jgi:flavin-dependent dehydrogenase
MEPVAGERPFPIAYFIPRKVFDAALVSAALLRGAADFTGFKLEKADRCDGRWSLELSGEPPGRPRRRITADFLIGADGGTSRVRRALGLALNSDAHTSIAIRAYARVTAPRKPLMQIDMINGIIWPGYAGSSTPVRKRQKSGSEQSCSRRRRSGVCPRCWLLICPSSR